MPRVYELPNYTHRSEIDQVRNKLAADAADAAFLQRPFAELVGASEQPRDPAERSRQVRTMNNLAPEAAIGAAIESARRSLQGADPDTTRKVLRGLAEGIQEAVARRLIDTAGPGADRTTLAAARAAAEAVGRYVGAMTDQAAAAVDRMTSATTDEEFVARFGDASPDAGWMTATLGAVAGASGYRPDPPGLLRDKGVGVDMDDVAHSIHGGRCDFFVSNGARLKDRLAAGAAMAPSKTKRMTLSEFINGLQAGDALK